MISRAVDGIRRGLLEMEEWPPLRAEWTVVEESSERVSAYDAALRLKHRIILTSPPYATALPYIDTDRLSVVALGLASAERLGALERTLIGSRDWARAEQIEWDTRRRTDSESLPESVTCLVDRIETMNQQGGAGFRRQAVPTLLYRYFARMAQTFDRWHDVLATGEFAVLIVGHNHTTAAGERVDIATPELLADIAETRGFTVSELIKLETWPRYGLRPGQRRPGRGRARCWRSFPGAPQEQDVLSLPPAGVGSIEGTPAAAD